MMRPVGVDLRAATPAGCRPVPAPAPQRTLADPSDTAGKPAWPPVQL